MRLACVSIFALGLAACGSESQTQPEPTDARLVVSEQEIPEASDSAPSYQTVTSVLDAPWRSEGNRARDEWRNPAETLDFFDIDPSGTVMEIWPGGGWYTDIIAPWTGANGGTYVAGWPPVDPTNDRAVEFRDRFLAKFEQDGFPEPVLAPAGPDGIVLPDGVRPDAIVTFRNTHSFMSRGAAEAMYAHFFDALTPGGVLGVVQHRLPADVEQDPRVSTGYLQEDIVRALAEGAGFVFEEASEINANPADTSYHPFGVWTLPPVGRTSAFGEPANPDFDRAPFDAIGESDRMTLRFRKPATPVETETEAEGEE